MSGICTAVLVYFLKATIFVMKVSKVKNRNEIKKEAVGAKCKHQDETRGMARGLQSRASSTRAARPHPFWKGLLKLRRLLLKIVFCPRSDLEAAPVITLWGKVLSSLLKVAAERLHGRQEDEWEGNVDWYEAGGRCPWSTSGE